MVVERKIRSTAGTSTRITDGIFQPNPQHKGRPGRVAVVTEGEKEPVDLEDDDDDEEEAEAAFAVLVEQGKEVAAEASRASSSI